VGAVAGVLWRRGVPPPNLSRRFADHGPALADLGLRLAERLPSRAFGSLQFRDQRSGAGYGGAGGFGLCGGASGRGLRVVKLLARDLVFSAQLLVTFPVAFRPNR